MNFEKLAFTSKVHTKYIYGNLIYLDLCDDNKSASNDSGEAEEVKERARPILFIVRVRQASQLPQLFKLSLHKLILNLKRPRRGQGRTKIYNSPVPSHPNFGKKLCYE